jgi:hypothetical protein
MNYYYYYYYYYYFVCGITARTLPVISRNYCKSRTAAWFAAGKLMGLCLVWHLHFFKLRLLIPCKSKLSLTALGLQTKWKVLHTGAYGVLDTEEITLAATILLNSQAFSGQPGSRLLS